MANLLIITDVTRLEIQKIIAYAGTHPVTVMNENCTEVGEAGNNPHLVLYVPIGIKCVFSHEIQGGILFRHFSMSVDEANRYPSPPAVDMMLQEFGFRWRVKDRHMILWQDEDNQAINCLEVVNPSDEPKVFKTG